MKKDLSIYPKVSVRKKYNIKTLTLKTTQIILVLSCICLCVLLLAPLFNLTLFRHVQYKFCTTYYIVYTTPDEDTKQSAIELSQDLHARGAGGNVTQLDKKYIVVMSQFNTNAEANKVVTNLKAQDISAQIYTVDVGIDCSKLDEENQKVLQSLYATNINTINTILGYIMDLDKSNISDTDVSIEIYSLYTTYENISIKYESNENTKIKKYLSSMQKIQSLLYLLSQQDRVSSNLVSYVSQIRNYVYKILEILAN